MEELSYESLIPKYLSNDISEEERQKLLAWANLSIENKEILEDAQRTWQLTAHAKAENIDFETEAEWRRFSAQIHKESKNTVLGQETASKHQSVFYSPAFRIAASIALLLGIFFILYRFLVTETGMVEKQTASNEKTMLILPDGSQVWLNGNSKVSYPREFNSDERIVYLAGEAFFDVKRDSLRPFLIYSEETQVKVLGTSFNVRAYERDEVVAVTVATGKVSFATEKGEESKVILEPGSKGIYYKSTNALKKISNTDANFLAWKTGKLIFKNTKLSEVIASLEDYYSINVEVDNKAILSCQFTSTFQNASFTEVLETLSISLNLSYTRKNDSYIISGEGCGEK